MIFTALIVALFCMVLVLVRAVKGSTMFDRMLAANTFGTKTVIFIILLGMLTNEMALVDVAFVYALINFISTIGVLKYFSLRSLGKE